MNFGLGKIIPHHRPPCFAQSVHLSRGMGEYLHFVRRSEVCSLDIFVAAILAMAMNRPTQLGLREITLFYQNELSAGNSLSKAKCGEQ